MAVGMIRTRSIWGALRLRLCRQLRQPDRRRRRQPEQQPVAPVKRIGALMRCSPIGIWARDAAEASAAARADAALSHPHPVCQAASAAFVAAIATAVGGGDRDAMLR